LNEPFDGGLVFLVCLQPDDAAECVHIVINRHKNRIRERRSGVGSPLASNLVSAVQVVITNPDVDVQKTGPVLLAAAE